MSLRSVAQALDNSAKDDALARHFLAVWPIVESILEAFSKATSLPIFAYLNEAQVFQSSMQTMPPFCAVMLGSPETRRRCIEDGLRRAARQEPDFTKGVQLCHAGMANGRREIDTGVGTLVILFGSKKTLAGPALERRHDVMSRVRADDPELADRLSAANENDANVGMIEPSDAELMGAISNTLQQLINATVGFRSLTINMTHELSVMLLGMGFLVQEMEHLLQTYGESPASEQVFGELQTMQSHISNECRLGLYIVRNFLSHASETRYTDVVKPHFEMLDLGSIVKDMTDLHRWHAATKNVSFDLTELQDMPRFRGSEMEIRRLVHNVLNNAIKYSYHSIPNAQRTIKVKSKVPYDPGFRKRRFALSVENYGLGLTESERHNVLKPGFRGEQAIAEVPIGAGIGLSEAAKIMKAHGGHIQIRSKELYEDQTGQRTYLTTVDLIFPYAREK